MSAKFSFIPVHSQFIETEEALKNIVGKYFELFESIGSQRKTKETLDGDELLVYLMVTGGIEQQVLDLKYVRSKTKFNEPVYLIAHPTHNSLPASLETLAKLQQDGIDGKIFYLNGPEDKIGLKKISDAVESHNVWNDLNNTKIGLIGDPSDWLVASSPDPSVVKEIWGADVVKISIDEIMNLIKNIPDNEVGSMLDSLSEQANEIVEPSKVDLENNVKVYLALKKIIEQYKLDAVTIRCFDLVLDIKTTGCFGLAQLNDDGYIAGCEGDLVSTIGMLWTNKLLNQIPWMANPAQLNEEDNSLWLAHCTVPRSLVENYDIRSHFESGLGVGIQGHFPKGPVTLLRLGGKKIDKIWLAEGEIIQTGNSEHLCRTQIEIKLSQGNVTDLLSEPLGNHIILVNGHHAEKLKAWWRMLINR